MKSITKMNKQETGRSMVEMLGVLAVVGVLSIGAIAGYTLSMRTHRANEMVNAISTLYTTGLSQAGGIGGNELDYVQAVGELPKGATRLTYNADTTVTIDIEDANDCATVKTKLGDKASECVAATAPETGYTLIVTLGEAGATNTPERNCWVTNDCTADDATPGERWCDGGLHTNTYCSELEACLIVSTPERCKNIDYKDNDKTYADCRKTGEDPAYCGCIKDSSKAFCDCMREGNHDMSCCLCLEDYDITRCAARCKYDPEGYTGPTSPVYPGSPCYYSDDEKYACGGYNYVYRCSDSFWDVVGYQCTDGCEDNGWHDNPGDTCKNKKKEEMI